MKAKKYKKQKVVEPVYKEEPKSNSFRSQLSPQRLQLLVIVVLAILAISMRIQPLLPGQNMAGHLISMDDPYYHYKYTNILYQTGDIPYYDHSIYPPEGRMSPEKFPYYYNAFIAHATGNNITSIILLYPILIAAFGTIVVFFLLKEMTGKWQCGAIGGFFFATMPAILMKSVGGAVEEDLMGLVLGLLSLYLLIKAINSEHKYKFAILSGIFFFITFVSWKGIIFLYAIPFIALSIYAIIAFILKKDVWETVKVALIAGIIPLIGYFTFIRFGDLNIEYIGPLGLLMFIGILGEFLRVRYWKQEDHKTGFEKEHFTKFLALIIILAIGIVAIKGIDNILNIPQKAYDEFAGTSGHNFLVDKTIAEQNKLASGSIVDKLTIGYRSYGIAELLTVTMAIIIPLFLIYYFYKDRDKMFKLLLPYLIALLFFLVAMEFVWIEARLTFSQSIGFLMLGAMVGILTPGNWKEIKTPKIIFGIIVIFVLLSTTQSFTIYSSVDPSWFNAVKWLDNNIETGHYEGDTYVNGDTVLTWWDYGHFITSLSGATVVADPLQAGEDYIIEIARFFYAFNNEQDAIEWLKAQPWNVQENGEYKVKYIILDYSLIGKASAVSFLGTNYYEVPNGQTAVNGVCSVGELCQNVETGEVATLTTEGYKCKSDAVCPRDKLTGVSTQMCCESSPNICCDMSLDWHVILEGGSAKVLRRPGEPVYGSYQLTTGDGYICNPNFMTSDLGATIPINNQSKLSTRRLLYMGYAGLPYADGKSYPAFLHIEYSDGTTDGVFIDQDCSTVRYSDLMSQNKDLLTNMGYGVKIGDSIAPQILVHTPEKWLNSMFTELFIKDATTLSQIDLIQTEETQKLYPNIKIYRITYET